MKINGGWPSAIFPCSLDDTGWQWQQTLTAHDPTPPITLETGGGPPFPTQYFGLRIRKGAANLDLCLVADADAPTGMGGRLKVRKGGTTYAAYLVETSDPNASAVRIRTTTGTKAIRLKT